MSAIRVGCQTYTWEMLGPAWKGKVTDILDQVAGAGYAGIEITNTMIGEFTDRPQAFAEELARRGLKLAAFAYATTGFTDPARREEDLAGARKAIEFVRHFPRAEIGPWRGSQLLGEALERRPGSGDRILQRGGAPRGGCRGLGERPSPLALRIAPRDFRGVRVPDGPPRPATVELRARHRPHHRGGQDILACLRTYLGRISHLHLKDVTTEGTWAALGEGICDFRGVLGLLESAGFDGWVVAEEESGDARRDGAAAIRRTGHS